MHPDDPRRARTAPGGDARSPGRRAAHRHDAPAAARPSPEPAAAPVPTGRRAARRAAERDGHTAPVAGPHTVHPSPEHTSPAHAVPEHATPEPAHSSAPAGPPPDHTGHGHGHGHGPATPAGHRVRKLLFALLVPCGLATLVGVVLLWPGAAPIPSLPPTQTVHADVTAVQVADCSPGSGDRGCTGVTVAMSDGPRAGRDLVQLVPVEPSTPRFAVGDPVVLSWSGGNPDEAGSYQLSDFQRGPALAWLAGAFALAVVLLGRLRGVAALVGLLLSFVVLLWFVLPSILSGHAPLAVAVTGSCLIMFAVLYLTHGFNARTSCAVLGTLASLALIGLLGWVFSAAARLTGLDDTTSNLIGTLGSVPIDTRGLVLAGLVIGALGVLDDVTVTQAAAVWELGSANHRLGARELYAAGMRIGRDHVASAVNTLVLAYAGAALPLMLLFTVSSTNFTSVLTSQDVATEIVRTLVGSIGLVASVPVTTGLAALVVARGKPEAPAGAGARA
ncbi:YibE/F family protein [Pseudonocardia phyllosphaerae]|uniref:YibE/F family protein n=1 Tax=Pseudonocardia phyllosphaerae TaxID=3390502 RepID=UPI00397AA635